MAPADTLKTKIIRAINPKSELLNAKKSNSKPDHKPDAKSKPDAKKSNAKPDQKQQPNTVIKQYCIQNCRRKAVVVYYKNSYCKKCLEEIKAENKRKPTQKKK
tara:strand:+ start:392 stop:700 length:309 start_codon:yes stop_codon:yes gene_type:complete